jgi:hypothetical protein
MVYSPLQGRLAQRESAAFTRQRSLVRTQHRPLGKALQTAGNETSSILTLRTSCSNGAATHPRSGENRTCLLAQKWFNSSSTILERASRLSSKAGSIQIPRRDRRRSYGGASPCGTAALVASYSSALTTRRQSPTSRELPLMYAPPSTPIRSTVWLITHLTHDSGCTVGAL